MHGCFSRQKVLGDVFDVWFGVAEEHLGIVAVEQRVLYAAIYCVLGAFEPPKLAAT